MARSSAAAVVAVALASVALAVPRGGRAAELPKLAVLNFNGPPKEAQKAQAVLERILRKKFELVSQAIWDETAVNLVATARSRENLGAVAKDLGVKVIITGAIKNEGGWQVVVTVRDVTGNPLEKLRYPLKGPKIDPATLKQMAAEVVPLAEKTGGAEVAEPEPETPPEATSSTEEESPLAQKKPKKKKKKDADAAAPEEAAAAPGERQARPAWLQIIDGSIGFSLSGRTFTFDAPATDTSPQYRSTVAPGLRFDVSVFPLALLATRPGAGWNALAGLGIGSTADVVFWPASVPRDQTVMTCGGPPPCAFGTSEFRVEAGLRWHWNFLHRPTRPELLLDFEWGLHFFTVGKRPDGSTVGPPDVTYNYLTIGVGARIPFIPQLALLVMFNLHPVLDSGGIRSAGEFGPGGTFGLRVGGGLEVRPWRGLLFRVAGFYERFSLGFSGGGLKPTTVGATDQYYGGWLTVGYSY